jgi:hypothetical protein
MSSSNQQLPVQDAMNNTNNYNNNNNASMFERLLQQQNMNSNMNNSVSSNGGMAGNHQQRQQPNLSSSSPGAPGVGNSNNVNNLSGSSSDGIGNVTGGTQGMQQMTNQDFLAAHQQRERSMLAALQQQQQRQMSSTTGGTQPGSGSIGRQVSTTGTTNNNNFHQHRAAHGQARFMVDDFAGAAGAFLSRPEHEFLLAARYPGVVSTGHHHNHNPLVGSAFNHHQYPGGVGAGIGLGTTMADLQDHSGKLADLLMAKQAAAAAAFHHNGTTVGGIGGPIVGGGPARSMLHHSSVTRLPCQARGMKADHNSSTAFFEIPDEARHGQHLLCSHPACRAAGVKFRYCLYCRKPVTKVCIRQTNDICH